MRILFVLLVILFSTHMVKADECRWQNKIPCTTITKAHLGNSNQLGDKISPTTIITKQQIEKYNLIDLTSVMNHVQGLDVSQSGPTGQQASLFIRGTNSNHVLVLLNGIPINDFSTSTGLYDFGQDFMFNVQQIEIYKGTAGAHFGADAIGGAVNIVTAIDYENKMSVSGAGNNKTVSANYTTIKNDWHLNVKAGTHQSKTQSALAGGSDKDGVDNKTVGINVNKWFDNLHFRTNLFTRNTFSDIDGHSLAIQEGWSDNSFYAFQTGIDYVDKDYTNSLTLHSHEYNRKYNDAFYKSQSYVVKAEHKTEKYGLGIDYKNDESLTADNDNVGFFGNFQYNIFSYHYRKDNKHDSYKIGFLQPITDSLTVRGNHATGYKNKTLWGDEEHSNTNEINLDYNNLTMSLFQTDSNDLNTDGVELSYQVNNFTVYGSHLNSKNKDTVQLRRPTWNFGLLHNYELPNKVNINSNYKFKGQHLDVHNSNWSTISMPETHLLDVNVSKNFHGVDLGLSITNVFNENYQSPHGFSQEGRSIYFGLKRIF